MKFLLQRKHSKETTALILLGLMTIFLTLNTGCGNSEKLQQRYVKKAMTYANLGKFAKAEEILEKAVGKYPESELVVLTLGNVYARQRKNEQALEYFDKLIALNPESHEAYLQKAKVRFQQQEFETSLQLVDKSLEIEETYLDAVDFKGIVHMKLEQFDEAIADYEAFINLKPNKPEGYLSLANVYLAQRNIEKTRELCQKVLDDVDSNNVRALLLISLILEMEGKTAEAVEILAATLEETPGVLPLMSRISELYLKTGDLENAMIHAENSLRVNPQTLTARYVKGTVHFVRQEYDKAAVEFENFQNPPPNYGDVFYKLGLCYLEMDNPQQGINELKKMIDRYPRFVPAYFTLAFTYLKEGWAEEAITLCQTGLDLSPNNIKGLEIMAKANIANKNFDAAEATFDKLVELRPDNVADILSLASLKINKGDIESSFDLCSRVLELNEKNINAHSIIAFCYIRQGKVDNAVDSFRKVIEIDPLNIGGHLNLAKIYSSVQRFDEAEQELLTIIDLKPDYRDAYMELGNLYYIQKEYDKAGNYYTQVLRDDPENIAANLSLANCYFIQEEYNKAQTLLAPFSRNPKYDDNLQLHSFLATLYRKLDKADEAEETYKKLMDLNPKFRPAYDLGLMYIDQGRTEESIKVYKRALKFDPNLNDMMLVLAVAQQENGDYDDSIDSIKKLIAVQPQNYALYFMQFNVYSSAGQYEEAEEILENIPEISDEVKNAYMQLIDLCKKNPVAGKRLAYLLNQMKIFRVKGWNDQSIALAEEAAEIDPNNILPPSFLAEIYMADREFDKAEKAMEQILAINENSYVATTRLSRLYSATGETEKAIKYLRKAIEIAPDSGFLYLDLGVLYEMNGQIDEAIAAYKANIDKDPESFRALNNIAWLISESNLDIAEAEEYAKRANELAPRNGAISDTYGWILYKAGKYDQAKKSLELATRLIPNNATIAYHLGKTYIALKENDNARIALEKSLDIDPNSPEADEVNELLKGLQ